jgi:prepilin-type N-terminal cleavage/methylation domain-containing protein
MRKRQAGFSLIEVVITTVILASVFLMVYLILSQSSAQFSNETRMANIQENARRVLDDMVNEIRMADFDNVFVLDPGATFSGTTTGGTIFKIDNSSSDGYLVMFQTPVKAVTAGNTVTVTYSGDKDQSGWIVYRLKDSVVDADNNSIADDCQLVREVRDASDPSTILSSRKMCDYVLNQVTSVLGTEYGLTITQNPNDDGAISNLTIRLTMKIANGKRYNAAYPLAHIFKTYVESSVRLRNNK